MSLPADTASTRAPLMISLAETLLWLCSIPSPIGEEKALCDAVLARLARVPLAAPIRRYGDSIVVPLLRSGTKRPHVALVGHFDTVRTKNGPARIEGDRCFGAGAADMKAGLATMIVLAETLGEDSHADITLVFYAREEGPYAENELGVVLAEDPELAHVDLAVCLEPSDNHLQLGCCGSIHATVTFHGRSGHSARPWEGQNAVTMAAPLLGRLMGLAPVENKIDGLVYRTVTTVTQAHDGGRGRNVVPDVFTINLNHRFAPGTTPDAAKASIVALVGSAGEVEFTDVSPAALPNAEHPLVKALLGHDLIVEPKQAWTDVARFSARGIAAVNFGPGESKQAHQPNESTGIGLLLKGYEILDAWLSEL